MSGVKEGGRERSRREERGTRKRGGLALGVERRERGKRAREGGGERELGGKN